MNRIAKVLVCVNDVNACFGGGVNRPGFTKATSGALDAISSRIGDVSRSITEIYSNVAEMQTGGRQILKAMSDLKGRTADLTDRSRDFDSATGKLVEGMDSPPSPLRRGRRRPPGQGARPLQGQGMSGLRLGALGNSHATNPRQSGAL
jgi:hypothetical protein